MTMARPRTRLVYFRTTEAEFERIRQIADATGARSVSDLVRIALDRFITEESVPQDELARTHETLRQVLAELRENVQQLAGMAARSREGAQPLETQAVRQQS